MKEVQSYKVLCTFLLHFNNINVSSLEFPLRFQIYRHFHCFMNAHLDKQLFYLLSSGVLGTYSPHY